MKKFLSIILSIFLLAFNAHAQRDRTLIIGMNISDGRTYDPSRQAEVSPPLTLGNVYETLITVSANNYEDLKPALAKRWESSNSGKSWRFYLRENAKFWNGEPVTAHDVKFSFDRLKNLKDQPAYFAENIKETVVIDNTTFDVFMENPQEPLLPILTTVSLSIFSKKQLEALGGVSNETSKDKDTATRHLDEKSYGSGPYRMTRWTRNEIVVLERNPFWHEKLHFDRVIIRHIADGAAQFLALQRNDIDIAFNLSNEQIELAKNKDFRIVSEPSLDYVYMALTNGSQLNSALANKNARLAIAHAIDYDGIIKNLLGNYGIRPASILPIGIGGATNEQTEKFGYRFDLEKARKHLSMSNNPNGFEFNFAYSTTPTLNVSTSLLAQKIQSDLAKINIKVNLTPMDASSVTTQYRTAKLQASIVSFTIDALEPSLWTKPFVRGIAKRMHWQPSKDLVDLAEMAAMESNVIRRNAMYEQYQKNMVDEAIFINLVQPTFKIASNKQLKNVNLTAAGWYMNLGSISR